MDNTKNIEDKKYIFKCGHEEGEHHCNGVHEFIISDDFIEYIIYRMIWIYNFKVDKYLLSKTIENLHTYVEERYKKNQGGEPVFNHWSKIDIYAEFLYDFMEKEFGKPDEQILDVSEEKLRQSISEVLDDYSWSLSGALNNYKLDNDKDKLTSSQENIKKIIINSLIAKIKRYHE